MPKVPANSPLLAAACMFERRWSFSADFALNGERFEFPFDGHWNARGHDVAARAIASAVAELGVLVDETPALSAVD
jgi:hypothetical protein